MTILISRAARSLCACLSFGLLGVSLVSAQSLGLEVLAASDVTVFASGNVGIPFPDSRTTLAGTSIVDGFALDAARPGSQAHVDVQLDESTRTIAICQSANAQVGVNTSAFGRVGTNVFTARFVPTRSYSGSLVVRWNGLSQDVGSGTATLELDVGADGVVDFIAQNGQVRTVSFGRTFDVDTPLEVSVVMFAEAIGTTQSAFHGLVELEFVPDAQTVAPGSFTSVGFGCPSSNGLPPTLVEAPPITGPLLGEDWTVEIRQLPMSTGFPVFNPAPVAFGLFGLTSFAPVNLGFVGAPFCFLFQTADFVVPLARPTPVGSDVVRWTLPVPDDSGLIGFEFFQQALVVDSNANALGLISTNSSRSLVGGR